MPLKKKHVEKKLKQNVNFPSVTTYCFLCAEFFLDPSGKSVILIAIYWKIPFTRKIIEKQCLFFIFLHLLKKISVNNFLLRSRKITAFSINCIFIFARIVGFIRQVEHIKWKICSKLMGRKINRLLTKNWANCEITGSCDLKGIGSNP